MASLAKDLEGTRSSRRIIRDGAQGITRDALNEALGRAGVLVASDLVYEESRSLLRGYMEDVLRSAVTRADHARRQTIISSDITQALVRSDGSLGLLGFGHPQLPPTTFCTEIHRVLKQVPFPYNIYGIYT